MTTLQEIQRNLVLQQYESARLQNQLDFAKGKSSATEHYIFPNQIHDAQAVLREFRENGKRVVSICKKTKLGLDGLMIEIATRIASHPDNDFMINPDNVRILTGMNNKAWEDDMKYKSPSWLKDKIFHHGQLKKSELKNLKNGLIIIDEIDSGNKERQVLHLTLRDAGILDVKHLVENNIYLVFASATMLKELYHLYRWGDLHAIVKMTIPDNYIGHYEFLQRGIIKEFYSLETTEAAERWIEEDILTTYEFDYRVHFVRVNSKSLEAIQSACIVYGIQFRNHTSTDRLSREDCKELFEDPISSHVIVAVKRLMSRANLIPWKKRIGAVHELYTKKIDNNVQIQGLVGRMTGYWRKEILDGHITGPYRTSIQAVKEDEENYHNPFGDSNYQCSGFTKREGIVRSSRTMVSPENVAHLDAVELPKTHPKQSCPVVVLKLDPSDVIQIRNPEATLALIQRKHPEAYELYKTFIVRCWKVDTKEKVIAWSTETLRKPNAWSICGGISAEDKQKNILMTYHYNDELILSPWKGAA